MILGIFDVLTLLLENGVTTVRLSSQASDLPTDTVKFLEIVSGLSQFKVLLLSGKLSVLHLHQPLPAFEHPDPSSH